MQDTPQGSGQSQGPQTPPPSQTPPPQAPPPTGGQVSQNRTIMLVLAYLWILALIPLLTEKDDAEVQWHAKYGIVLTVTWIVVWVVLLIIAMIPVVGQIIGCLLSVVLPLGILAIHIICIIKAVNGERFRLPVIADFADQWK